MNPFSLYTTAPHHMHGLTRPSRIFGTASSFDKTDYVALYMQPSEASAYSGVELPIQTILRYTIFSP